MLPPEPKVLTVEAKTMWRWRSVLICCFLFSYTSAQLTCQKGYTNTYNYKNEVKLWGEAQQKFEVACSVEIDCKGESTLSTKTEPAYDFTAHFSDLKVKETKIRPEDALKLCHSSQNSNSRCSLNNSPENSGSQDKDGSHVVVDDGQFNLPVVFTQTASGKILRIQFTEKDLENTDVVNIKRGIISTLQTQMNTNSGEEEDSTGKHKSLYTTSRSADETVITKEYYDKDDDGGTRRGRPANLRVKARTTVRRGDITSSEGEASSLPETGDEDEDDIPPDVESAIRAGDVLKSESKYRLSLTLKRKRTSQRVRRMASFKWTEFIDTPITMESSLHEEDEFLNRLDLLYSRLEKTPLDRILAQFSQSKDEVDLELLKEIVTLEANIGYEKVKTKLRRSNKSPLIDTLIPRAYGMLAQCHVTWNICEPMLSLFAQGGGVLAEEVFQYLLSADSKLTHEQMSRVIDTVSTMANPSDNFIKHLMDLYESDFAGSEEARSLLLVIGALAGQDSVSDSVKAILRGILLTQLADIREENCPEDTDHIDALEAVGNMADEKLLSRILEIGSVCETSGTLRIAAVHAVRGFVNKPETIEFFIQILESADCEVVEEVIHLLMDIMANQKSGDNLSEWPLVGLNDFDRALVHFLTQTDQLGCVLDTAVRYFEKKLQTDVDEILVQLRMSDVFSSSPETNHTGRIQKRSLKHATCSVWSNFNGRYSDIQSASTFQTDVSSYNRRRHCLAHFGVGGSKARADLYGGFFVGCDTRSSRAKLFARVVAKGKVFSKTFSIATIYAYFINSNSGISAKVYVNVGGKTYVSLQFRAKPQTVTRRLWNPRPLTIRLLRIPLLITSINVYVSITPSLNLDQSFTSCQGSATCLQLIPRARARAAAGASISLFIVRGGADIGFNFNYYLKAEVRLYSSCKLPCVSLSHGHDRNSISIEFWYQFRGKIRVKLWPPWKIRIRWEWGPRKVYRPSSLSWSVGSSRERRIASTCPKQNPPPSSSGGKPTPITPTIRSNGHVWVYPPSGRLPIEPSPGRRGGRKQDTRIRDRILPLPSIRGYLMDPV